MIVIWATSLLVIGALVPLNIPFLASSGRASATLTRGIGCLAVGA